MSKTPIAKTNKGNSAYYALAISLFLIWQGLGVSYSKEEGWTIETKPVPLQVLAPCLVFMAAAVGINIKQELAIVAAMVSRNSAAIAVLAEQAHQQQQQQQLPQDIEQSIDNKNDDPQKLQ